MARFTDAASMARSQDGRFKRVNRRLIVTALEVEPVRRRAKALTSGGISQSELNRRGNPFGRGNGRSTKVEKIGNRRRKGRRTQRTKVATPLLPINKQSGKLQQSLKFETIRRGDELTIELRFSAKHAKWILNPKGTSKMVGRGFWVALSKTQRYHAMKIAAAASRAFNEG